MARLRTLLSVGFLMLIVCRANADLTFTLTPSSMPASPGNIVTFSGLLQNNGVSAVFLNGDVNPGITPLFSVDDTKFFFNAPLSLAPGDSWNGDLFDVTISPSAPAGDYSGDFTILGGADGSALDVIGNQTFTVTLPSAATPECGFPGMFASATSLFMLYRMRRLRSRRSS